MGYTHYWKSSGKGLSEKNLIKAIEVMGKIVKDQPKLLASWEGTGEPLVTEKEINFNGKEDNSHENFVISVNWNGGFNFCKTARKPYDLVVVACLAVLKHFCKDTVHVRSDGDTEEELGPGIALAKIYIPTMETDFTKIFN